MYIYQSIKFYCTGLAADVSEMEILNIGTWNENYLH